MNNKFEHSIKKLLCFLGILCVVLSVASCHTDVGPTQDNDTHEESELQINSENDPKAETDTEATVESSSVDTDAETEEPAAELSIRSVIYTSSSLPDYSEYLAENRIKKELGACKSYAFTLNGSKYYENGELKNGGKGVIVKGSDGKLTVDSDKLCKTMGKTDIGESAPDKIAEAMGMRCVIYDNKLLLLFEGEKPLDSFKDTYTLEAMHLYMTGADETELENAFIDLPSIVTNNTNNSTFYTAPDLNLGVQTSVYFAQIGQNNGLETAPAIVAGEGRHKDNFTTVRIFNNQNACVSQFLAFDASVKGGVQVAAAKVGDEVLIATAPFSAHNGNDGDIRIFDTYGLIRMKIDLRDEIPAPHTILTGHFVEGVEDEVLLVSSQTTNESGELVFALISLTDGSVLSIYELDCSFALTDNKAGVPVELSPRHKLEGADTVILYFNSVQAVYEGNAYKAEFENARIKLPEDAISVSASEVEGQKYIVSIPETEGDENLSYIIIYGENEADGEKVDVGFRENRFYSSLATEYNDDRYISKGTFAHVRTDLANSVLRGVKADNIDSLFEQSLYEDYASLSSSTFVNRLANEYLMLEPCFTHRWNKIPATQNLINYTDPITGIATYASVGKDNNGADYNELNSSYYIGTYADGILDLAKLRIFPLRSFLQDTAVAFRGKGGVPEHLVGVSPVHEQEINVPGSVGDYNHYMVEGFRVYLLDRYESLEKINAIFGTTFSDRADIDAPRDSGRGAWDAYSGDYFIEWTLYNRYIISKRIMEAYREALLAGYPPEAISAHSIPEAEAVAGFLGEANTRITPIDVVLTCGTAYGGTRYGVLNATSNLAYNAQLMGHHNITLGEYGARTQNLETSYNQLKLLWNSGVRMVHQMTFGDKFLESEQYAIDKMMEENDLPRPGYTGGTTNSVSVHNESGSYNIVQIGEGEGSDSVGLLKSVAVDGSWEGTVYLVPFHSKMNASAITALKFPVSGTQNIFSTGNIGRIKNADQLEITFIAAKDGEASAYVTFEVYQDGCLLKDSAIVYELTETMTPYRYVLSNQLFDDDLEIRITFHNEANDGSMESVRLEDMRGTLQTERVYFKYYDGAQLLKKNKAHVGGVTFDLLDR